VEDGARIAVKLCGNELSRGRGGPRCMTMPLVREG
jgi:arginine deiminase